MIGPANVVRLADDHRCKELERENPIAMDGLRTILTAGLAAVLFTAEGPAQANQPAPASDNRRVLPIPLPRSVPPSEPQRAKPIDWPTVLELARASNLEIQIAAEKVCEAHIQHAVARGQWLPSLQVGTTWLHHDGRIQDIPGQILEASKSSLSSGFVAKATIDPQKAWVDVLRTRQQIFGRSGELDRVTRQALLEASEAYVDLLAAQGGVAVSIELAGLIDDLVKRSEQLLAQGIGAQVDVLRNRAHYQSGLQNLNSAWQKQLGASAQIVGLLDLPPETRLYASDTHLVPVTLVDETIPEAQLVAKAMDQGPGAPEAFALVCMLEKQKERYRTMSFLPEVSFEAGESLFGGGTGSNHANFANRTDLGIGVQWDVMKLMGTSRGRQLFDSKRRQASLQHQQVKTKLGAAVVVALASAQKAKERIEMAEVEVDIAVRSYQLSEARLKAAETQSFEVLQAIAALSTARSNYLKAVIDYNRAQIQLQFLIGDVPSPPDEATLARARGAGPAEAPEVELVSAKLEVAPSAPPSFPPTLVVRIEGKWESPTAPASDAQQEAASGHGNSPNATSQEAPAKRQAAPRRPASQSRDQSSWWESMTGVLKAPARPARQSARASGGTGRPLKMMLPRANGTDRR